MSALLDVVTSAVAVDFSASVDLAPEPDPFSPPPPPERHKKSRKPRKRKRAPEVTREEDAPMVCQTPLQSPTSVIAGARRRTQRGIRKRPPESVDELREAGAFKLVPSVSITPATPSEVKRQTKLVLATLKLLYPNNRYDRGEVQRQVWEAHVSADDEYGVQEALDWAEGFTFPEGIGERDSGGLQEHGGNLSAFCAARHAEMSAGGKRLSRESIERMCTDQETGEVLIAPDDPDYLLLMELVDGIDIVTKDGFRNTQVPPPLRQRYKLVAPVVNKLMAELHSKGLIFILPTEQAMRIEGIHYSQTHWTFKKGKRQGRPIGDASATEHGGEALNGKEVKEKIRQIYGEIFHPTLSSLTDMVKEVSDELGWDNTVLWKIDLKGAFTLLFVKPTSCQRLAFALTGDLTMIYHVGMFGWTGMPAAFQVVTRVITRLVNMRLRGKAQMYVDDLMGCCHRDHLASELEIARSVCNGLLGDGAVEEKKTTSGRQQDFIGWQINLDRRAVSVAEHNYQKTLYGFLKVDTARGVKIRQIQSLASWASRYSAVCRNLKPFTQDLFDMVRGQTTHADVALSSAAVRAIEVWRGALLALKLHPTEFERPIHTLGTRIPSYLIEYDASLEGIGLVLSTIDPAGTRTLLYAAQLSLSSFDAAGDPGKQNTCEFAAVVAGLACLAALGVRGAGVKIIGDNQSSLQWCAHQRFHSQTSKATAVMYMALTTVCDLQVVDEEHIRGEWNIKPDRLSRGHSFQSQGFLPHQCFDLAAHPLVVEVVEACNPALDFEANDSGGFYNHWGRGLELAKALMSTPATFVL